MSEEKVPRKLKAKVVNAEATISVEKKSHVGENVPASTTKSENIGTYDFKSEPALVGIEYGMTLNMGNYEAARVSVSVRMPCAPGDVNKTYEETRDWAAQRVSKEITEIRNFMKNQHSL